MNILLANKLDYGGAGNACVRLHQGLHNAGIASKLLLKTKSNPLVPESYQISEKAVNYSKFDILSNKIKNVVNEFFPRQSVDPFIASRHQNLEFFSYPGSDYDLTKTEEYQWADVINLHWVSHLLDFESFFVKNTKPVVWTLHDQNPFTGGEHYEETLIDINEKGEPVNRIVSPHEKKIFAEVLSRKKKALARHPNLTIVSPSHWLADEARKSDLFSPFPVEVIPNGIDPGVFSIRDKIYSRELLSIPSDKKVLLFVAETVTDFRKGFVFLQKALEGLDRDNIMLLSIGGNRPEVKTAIDHIHLGGISNELLMSIIYSAADVFVLPSLMDNLPNTVLEALFCGTPVVAFPVGGIVDMLKEGLNGILCSELSARALGEGICRFLDKPEQFDSALIRNDAVQRFSLSKQVEAYTALYKKLAGN